MRRIYQTEIINGTQYKVYRNAANDEYIVRQYVEGKHIKSSDYYTNDKEDAISTARYSAVKYVNAR